MRNSAAHTVVIAHPDPVRREGLAALCNLNDTRVVAFACDTDEALLQNSLHRPSVTIVSNELPGMGALEVIRRSHAAGYPTRFLLLTEYYQELPPGSADAIASVTAPAREFCDILVALCSGSPFTGSDNARSPVAEIPPRLPEKPELPTDTMIGRYKVIDVIGRGGTGTVYRAFDPRLRRDVAIKVPLEKILQNRSHRDRIIREARAVSALNHPRIVRLHDVVSVGDKDCLIFEYLEGMTLRDCLAVGTAFTDDCLELVAQAADGLDAAHTRGIIHRDIKPGNLMLTSDGIRILDFGFALQKLSAPLAPTDSTLFMTPPNAIIGTVNYISPEQARSSDVGPGTDLFSLGCVLYELLTGRAPFDRASLVETLYATIREVQMPLPAEVPCHEALDAILAMALAKDPAARTEMRFFSQSLRDLIPLGRHPLPPSDRG